MGLLILAVSIILTVLPKVGYGVRVLNTLVHEFGHAVGAIVTSGKVVKIELYRDVSGVAQSMTKGGFSAILTTFIGYPFSSIISLWFVYLIDKGDYELVSNILIGVAVLSLIMWIRNLYGIIWTTLYLIISLVVRIYFNETLFQLYVQLNVGIIYFEAMYSTLVLAVLYRKGKDVGDATSLRERTGIPVIIWVILYIGISVTVFFYGLQYWM